MPRHTFHITLTQREVRAAQQAFAQLEEKNSIFHGLASIFTNNPTGTIGVIATPLALEEADWASEPIDLEEMPDA